MFDLSIKNNPSSVEQQKMVDATVRTRIADKSFTYTELCSALEPMRTMGFQYLDGIKINGSFPIGGGEFESWGGERFLLVAIDPSKPLKFGVIQDVPRAGTFLVERKKVMKDFGDIAYVTDTGPNERMARNLLVQRGFPILANRGNSREGDVVEWRWLEKEAEKGEGAAPGIVELYERLLPRVQAFLAAQNPTNAGTAGGGSEPKTEAAPVVTATKRPGRPKKTNDSKAPGDVPPAGV